MKVLSLLLRNRFLRRLGVIGGWCLNESPELIAQEFHLRFLVRVGDLASMKVLSLLLRNVHDSRWGSHVSGSLNESPELIAQECG